MCGITGIVCNDGSSDVRGALKAMTESLAHRGPDDEGIHIIRKADVHMGLGHRRLSIIDLSQAGHQPMTNEDGSLWLTYNGEIYNFKEVRAALIKQGHVFSSDTDTEVIIHGYEQYGIDILKRLNGMFAFGLWDERKRQLVLARDRYGEKPLYYRGSSTGILFASELKALFKHPEVERKIDVQSLSRYLLHEYVPAPHTMIKGISKLPPGHYLVWKSGEITVAPYWQISFNGPGDCPSIDRASIENQLLFLLRESVASRLVSDVPLGVFLSGGIDSSSIVAMMAELIPPRKIKTFSIGFGEKSFDESSYARSVARHFGTDHHERTFTAKMMLETLPEVLSFLDEPFADASVLPTYMLSKFTREFVTVALGGDGGDELFAGYDPFIAHKAAKLCRVIPRSVHEKILGPLLRLVPASTGDMAFDFKIKQFLKGMPFPPAIRNQVWLGSFALHEQKQLLTPDVQAFLNGSDPYEEINHSSTGMVFRDDVDQLTYLYSRYYLSEDILTKVDRASMAASLEVRSPYLDVALVQFVNNLPSDLKLRGLTRKYILKKSLEGKLSKETLYRKKKGFGIPLAKWFKAELKPMLLEVFSPARILRHGLFDLKATQTLLKEHFTGQKDNRKQIWTLLAFEMWRERFAASC